MRSTLYTLLIVICCVGNYSCVNTTDSVTSSKEDTSVISEDSLLNLVQYQTFQYFWNGAEPISGMARERIHMDDFYPYHDKDIITSGGSGFGLMALIVGIERGFITREQGISRFEKIINFLENAETFHGAWPHWWYGTTGKVYPFSEKDDGGDLVESSFLAAGLLTLRQYLNMENQLENNLIGRINTLWKNIEFDWFAKDNESALTADKKVLYWHWSPNYGWDMNFKIKGYNECLITYVLAASSPTHSISPEVYHQGWASSGHIAHNGVKMALKHSKNSPVGPLFWAHYSYLGLNPKNLKDRYANYWKHNQTHAQIHYKHSVDNPNEFIGYGEKCWGLTSSYSIKGYSEHKPDRDLGVISPTAALSSFPYTPKESMKMLKYLYQEADTLIGEYGPFDAFSIHHNWYLPRYLAIDQGPIPVMIENYRTGLIWKLFMSAPEVQSGLKKLDFSFE